MDEIKNSLIGLKPELVAKEWDYEKNNLISIFPDKVSVMSMQKVFWRCDQGHSWKASIHNRTKIKSTGCPICNSSKSFGEFALLYYLRKNLGSENVKSRVPLKNIIVGNTINHRRFEVDIYIESSNVVIEHNSIYHTLSQTKTLDTQKYSLIKKSGIKLITLYAYKKTKDEFQADYYYKQGSYIQLQSAIKQLLINDFKCQDANLDIRDDTMKILSLYYPKKFVDVQKKDHRLTLATEWDFTKNDGFSIFNFSPNSSFYAHWKCRNCGCQWISTISNRKKRGCPNEKFDRATETRRNKIKHTDSFKFKSADKMCQWDFTENNKNKIYPDEIHFKTNRIIVHWKCSKCGYHWQSYPSSMSATIKNGCKICGIESARKAKYKILYKIDPISNLIIEKFPSITAAKNAGYKKVDRAFKNKKLYKGFYWEIEKN